MPMEVKLFLQEHIDPVHSFEMRQLSQELSPIAAEMKSWEFPWRKESMEHYMNLGWSFVCLEGDDILGYVLAQPLLFFNNWTQSLWVEHLSATNKDVCYQLMDVVVRWSKTKHLQKVILNPKIESTDFIKENFNGFKEGQYLHLSTTKMSEE